MLALDAARGEGADYADARVMATRRQVVRTRDDRVEGVEDGDDMGFAVRVLVDGAWGYVGSPTVLRREAFRLARVAVAQARVTAAARRSHVELAPAPATPDGEWRSPFVVDPFDVGIDDKIDLLLRANEEARRAGGGFVESAIESHRVETTFASTDGTLLHQVQVRTYPHLTVTAVMHDGSRYARRTSAEVAPMGLGYEHVESADLPGHAGSWAEEAIAQLSAPSVEAGSYDLILHPSNLFLVIHETIGHATELDRAMGFEAGYAGTSFLAPPSAVLNQFRFGPEFMNVQGNRTERGGLATVGWDDEGVPADSWPIVRDGMFVDYQTTREQATWIAEYTGVKGSHGCAHTESWRYPPFQRMPNVSLLPGPDDHSLDDLIAATDRGLLIIGRGSYSIDQQRYNFQFGGQACYAIRNGKRIGQVRDVAFQGRTPEFWNGLDMLGGPRTYELGGTLYDGKGQPGQINAVSHGCPVARFKGVDVLNTAE
jgi:TldD protein